MKKKPYFARDDEIKKSLKKIPKENRKIMLELMNVAYNIGIKTVYDRLNNITSIDPSFLFQYDICRIDDLDGG